MLFISVEDFLTRASGFARLDPEEEQQLVLQMQAGDENARDTLVRSYLPIVAGHIRRAPQSIRTLRTVYSCIAETEKGLEGFNFSQSNQPFVHHLNWRLRQCITRCIAYRS